MILTVRVAWHVGLGVMLRMMKWVLVVVVLPSLPQRQYELGYWCVETYISHPLLVDTLPSFSLLLYIVVQYPSSYIVYKVVLSLQHYTR